MSETATSPANPAEEALAQAVAEGRPCTLTPEANRVRGEYLRHLLLRAESGPVAPFSLSKAIIEGSLNLGAVKLSGAMMFFGCTFEEEFAAADLRCGTLLLHGCHLPKGLRAYRAKIEATFILRRSRVGGRLDLTAADIATDLDLSATRLRLSDLARLERIQVGASLFLHQGMTCTHGLTLDLARIKGSVFASRSAFASQSGPALNLRQVAVGGSIELHRSALLARGPVALMGDGSTIAGFISLESSRVVGDLRLAGASIGGNLSLLGACVRGQGGPRARAVSVNTATVGGHFRFERARITGGLELSHAVVRGNLHLNAASITQSGDGWALRADGCKVGGEVVIVGEGRRTPTLTGRISFTSTEITQTLIIDNADLLPAPGTDASSEPVNRIELNRMRVGLTMRLQFARFHGRPLSLANTKVGSLADDIWSWRTAGTVLLDGFEYGTFLGDNRLSSQERLEWLGKQPSIGQRVRPQPFNQAAAVLRRMGYESEAIEIAVARRRLENHTRSRWRWVGYLLDWTSGYGYRPWRAGSAVLIVAVVGTLIFDTGRSTFVPIRDRAYDSTEWKTAHQPPPNYPAFRPVIYSLDVLLPFANFGQKESWAPITTRTFAEGLAYYWKQLQVLIGWALTTIFGLAVTGLIKRD